MFPHGEQLYHSWKPDVQTAAIEDSNIETETLRDPVYNSELSLCR